MALWLVHTTLEQAKRFAHLLTPVLHVLVAHIFAECHLSFWFDCVFSLVDLQAKETLLADYECDA